PAARATFRPTRRTCRLLHLPLKGGGRRAFARRVGVALGGTRTAPSGRTSLSKTDRNVLVDQDQDDQKNDSGREAPADQLLLDRQQRLDRGIAQLFADVWV